MAELICFIASQDVSIHKFQGNPLSAVAPPPPPPSLSRHTSWIFSYYYLILVFGNNTLDLCQNR